MVKRFVILFLNSSYLVICGLVIIGLCSKVSSKTYKNTVLKVLANKMNIDITQVMCKDRKLNLIKAVSEKNEHDFAMVKSTKSFEKVLNKDAFQLVADDTEMLVYAAYYDERLHKIRVIGVSRIKHTTMNCILSYRSSLESKQTEAVVYLLQDHKNLTYNVAFILCELYRLDVPDAVSVLKRNSCVKASNILPIRRKPTNYNYRMFSLCLSPLHSHFSDKLHLVEWIELNLILGVEKIIIYVQNCSLDVIQLLQIYESNGVVDIMNWSLPRDLSNKRKKNLHYYGQLAAINDCLYRNKGLSLYIAAFDIDEYIIPQLDEDVTWVDMLARLPTANAYIFRNSFFLINESGKFNSQMAITNATNFKRENLIYRPRSRSKFIAKTDEIYTTDIHFIREMNGNQHDVDPNIGLLHHYRRRIPNHNGKQGQHSKRKCRIQGKCDVHSVKNEATKKYSQILLKKMAWVLRTDTSVKQN